MASQSGKAISKLFLQAVLFCLLVVLPTLHLVQAEVLPDGSYLTSIPIEIPKGANGAQPTLSLSYVSSSSYGIAGPGWSLTGFPSIRRISSKSDGLALDSTDDFADPDGRFVFERVEGDVRHYRAALVSTSRYEAQDVGSYGPRKWKVVDKTGNTMYFGRTSNSRVSSDHVQDAYITWHLDRLETVDGNAYEISYDESANGVRYPKKVVYTIAPGITANKSIEFFYEASKSARQAVEAGSLVTRDRRLREVVVKISDLVYRTYTLAYADSDPTRPRDHLVEVTIKGIEADGIDTSGETKRSYRFNWETAKLEPADLGDVFEEVINGNSSPLTFLDNNNASAITREIDFNGDGRIDLVYIKSGADTRVFAGDVSGKFLPPTSLPGTAQSMSPAANTFFHTGDFNGDGADDVLRLRTDKAHTILMGSTDLVSEAVPLFADAADQPDLASMTRIVVDLNGDGADDLLLAKDNGHDHRVLYGGADGLDRATDLLLPADEAGTQWSISGTGTLLILDFDGNGWPDLLRSDASHQGKLFVADEGGGFSAPPIELQAAPDLFILPPTGSGSGFETQPNNLIFQDYDGDGRLDILRLAMDSSKNALFLFKGDRFVFKALAYTLVGDDTQSEWRVLSAVNNAEPTKAFPADRFFHTNRTRRVYTADFNGDGFQDILSTSNTQKNILLIWDGRDYRYINDPAFTDMNLIGNGSNQQLRILDANADGRDDLVRIYAAGRDSILLSNGAGFTPDADAILLPETTPARFSTAGDQVIPMDVDGNGVPELFVRRNAPNATTRNELVQLSAIAGERVNRVYTPDGAVLEINYALQRDVSPVDFAPLESACVPANAANPSRDCGIPDKSNRPIVKTLSAWASIIKHKADAESDEETAYGYGLPRVATKSGDDNGWLGFAERWVTDERTGSRTQTRYSQEPKLAHRPVEVRNFAHGMVPYDARDDIQKKLKEAQCGDVPYPVTLDNGRVPDLMSVECLSYKDWDPRDEYRMIARSERLFGTFYGGRIQTRHTTDTQYDQMGYIKGKKECAFWQDIPTDDDCVISTIGYYRTDAIKSRGLVQTNKIVSAGLLMTFEKFSYDDTGRLRKAETLLCERAEDCKAEQDGSFITSMQGLEYDAYGNITRVEDAYGNATRYDYDVSATYIVKETNALEQKSEFTFHPYGLQATKTDPNNQVTSTSYTPFGQIARVQFPDGSWQSKTRRITAAGTPEHIESVSQTNGGAYGVSRFFDGFGFEYESVTLSGDPLKKVSEQRSRAYVDRKLVEKVSVPHFSNAEPIWQETHYDHRGRPTKSVFAGSVDAEYFYPSWNETFVRKGRSTSRSIFDFKGRLISREQAAELDPDNQNQLPELNATINYTYDHAGRLQIVAACEVCVSPNPIRKIVNIYDNLGKIRERNDYAMGITKFNYTLTGQLDSAEDALGRLLRYEYDELDRLKTRTLGDDSTETYTYDEFGDNRNGTGRLTKIVVDDHERSFAYDPMGRITLTETSLQGLPGSYKQTWKYGHRGELISRRLPDGTRHGFSYTDAGNLKNIELNGNTVATYGDYRADGQVLNRSVSSAELGDNGQSLEIKHSYYPNTALKSRELSSPAGVLDSTYFVYNRDHTIREIRDERASRLDQSVTYAATRNVNGNIVWKRSEETRNTSRQRRFGYDSLQRLVSAKSPDTYGDKTFAYNTSGDITQIDGLSSRRLDYSREFRQLPGEREVSKRNSALVGINSSDDTLDYRFNAVGDLVSRRVGNDTWTYEFGLLHRLHSVKKNNQTVATYTYDNANERLSKQLSQADVTLDTFYITPQFEISLSSEQKGVFKVTRHLDTGSGERIASFSTLQNNPADQGLHELLDYAHEPLHIIESRELGRVNLEQDGLFGKTYLDQLRQGPRLGFWFYHEDYLGNVSMVTDVAGKVRNRLNYLPFGELSKAYSTGEIATDAGFGGENLDAETGLYYLEARYYDPLIGRFISPDTVLPDGGVDFQSLNRYAYASNNPASFTDPSGHWSLKRAFKDVVKVVKKVYKAGEAAVRATGRAVRNTGKAVHTFLKNVTHKPLDALVNLQVDVIKGQERAYRTALMESSVLQQVGAIAATFYGGPAGAAGFSAYMTYASGGTVEQALLAGLVSGSVSCLSAQVGVAPGDGAMDVAGKAVANGTVSAVGAGFVGGDPEDAFKKGATSTLIFAGIQAYTDTGAQPTLEKGEGSVDKPPGTDVRALDPGANHIGLARTGSGTNVFSEGGSFSNAVNEIPGMNSMAYLHDIMAQDVKFLSYHGPLQISIIPAVQLNYQALGVSRDRYLLEQSMERARKSGRSEH
jgi:RHS repeat-associated protein